MKKPKTYTEKEVREIIGRFAKESDGWNHVFEKCCPGEDIASAVNCMKLRQYKQADIPLTKKQYEEESGYIFVPCCGHNCCCRNRTI